jgi:hypothetical protein
VTHINFLQSNNFEVKGRNTVSHIRKPLMWKAGESRTLLPWEFCHLVKGILVIWKCFEALEKFRLGKTLPSDEM